MKDKNGMQKSLRSWQEASEAFRRIKYTEDRPEDTVISQSKNYTSIEADNEDKGKEHLLKQYSAQLQTE